MRPFLARPTAPPDIADSTLALLPRCRTHGDARQLHARLVTTGLLLCHPSLLLRRLFASPHPPLRSLARRIFFSLPAADDRPFLWNAFIGASRDGGGGPRDAVLAFALMLFDGVAADKFALSLALNACSRIPSLREGSQIHALLLKSDLASNLYLQNGLIALYSKCGLPEIARRVFDRITERDAISWNSMVDGYLKDGNVVAAQKLFDEMDNGKKNTVTWNTMLGGYAASIDMIDVARELFDSMPERDLVSWNLMIDGYIKCGRLVDAEELFERMPVRDVISWATMIDGYTGIGRIDLAKQFFELMPQKDVITWNIMMDGYVKNGRHLEALNLFTEMQAKGNPAPDITTLATALTAIAELGRVDDGIAIHDYIERTKLALDGQLGVALVDMYSKCGRLEDALKVFETSGTSVDHWNAMIGGLAIHGRGNLALQLFWEMKRCSLKPDDITFIGVLNACSHAGLVKEGLMCFEIMRRDYALEPKVQHYACMIDILGRAGQLEEALNLIRSMPIEPNDVVWRSLLSACRNHRNVGMGQKLLKGLTQGGAWDSSTCVLLSNLYAGVGMWGDVRKVRTMMREKDLKKVPGCSWIELDGIVHEFVVGDYSCPQAKEASSSSDLFCASNLSSSTTSLEYTRS
ncbi:unnamed protein product [Musa hybrid cultivar]